MNRTSGTCGTKASLSRKKKRNETKNVFNKIMAEIWHKTLTHTQEASEPQTG